MEHFLASCLANCKLNEHFGDEFIKPGHRFAEFLSAEA